MEKEQIVTEKLCTVCNAEAVWLDGMCQFCYEEAVEAGFHESSKEVMPKHGLGLKINPDLQQERAVKKNIKIKRRK